MASAAASGKHGRDGEEKSKLLLAFCAVGICGCFLMYGVCQEKIYNYQSPIDGSKMTSTLFLLVTQSISNSLTAKVAMTAKQYWCKGHFTQGTVGSSLKRKLSDAVVPSELPLNVPMLAITALLCCSAMASSNEALRFVSYPTQSLAKSCKLVPVMVMGLLVERRTYTLRQYLGAAAITVGIIAFNLSEIQNRSPGEHEDTMYGMLLLFASLIVDGLVAANQGMLNASDPTKYRRPNALETMLLMNVFSALCSLPVAVVLGQVHDGMHYMYHNPEVLKLVAVFNCSASAGQFFIFLTITQFSPLICTTITTTRKFISILLSVFSFGHVLTSMQWCSVVVVFCGLFLELSGSKRTKVVHPVDKMMELETGSRTNGSLSPLKRRGSGKLEG